MFPQKDKLKKGDIVIPFAFYSNGYDVTHLQEAIVINRFNNGAITIKCIKGFIRADFIGNYEFTVNEKDFILKTPKTISDYEIY